MTLFMSKSDRKNHLLDDTVPLPPPGHKYRSGYGELSGLELNDALRVARVLDLPDLEVRTRMKNNE